MEARCPIHLPRSSLSREFHFTGYVAVVPPPRKDRHRLFFFSVTPPLRVIPYISEIRNSRQPREGGGGTLFQRGVGKMAKKLGIEVGFFFLFFFFFFFSFLSFLHPRPRSRVSQGVGGKLGNVEKVSGCSSSLEFLVFPLPPSPRNAEESPTWGIVRRVTN